jgi:hypothetical protein
MMVLEHLSMSTAIMIKVITVLSDLKILKFS